MSVACPTALCVTACLAAAPGFSVFSNGRAIQAVRFDELLMAAFLFAGTPRDAEDESLVEVDHPCLLLVRGKTARVSNSAQQRRDLTVRLSGRDSIRVSFPGNEATVKATVAKR